MKKLKCETCGAGPFKKLPGLLGHQRIIHGVKRQPDNPGNIIARLEKLEEVVLTKKDIPKVAEEVVHEISCIEKSSSKRQKAVLPHRGTHLKKEEKPEDII